MNNNEIFEDFWKSYVWPEPAPIFYRLYYNDAGEPIAYSMEDQSGKYIEITAEQYAASDPHVRVKNGQLVKPTSRTVSKLKPAADGTPCHTSNVAIVVDDTAPNQKWKLKNYDNS
jgi:hypothetical protein